MLASDKIKEKAKNLYSGSSLDKKFDSIVSPQSVKPQASKTAPLGNTTSIALHDNKPLSTSTASSALVGKNNKPQAMITTGKA
jgi:hypothetical protein